ncbi:MAG: cytochrome c peroxidase [Gemmatimonadota bacterium]
MASSKLASVVAACAALWLAGCGKDSTAPHLQPALSRSANDSLAELVRTLTAGRGIGPLVRPAAVRPELVHLGQMLAFDKILSGNRDISCMSCHLPKLATGDGRSLSIGQGGFGLGPQRVHPEGIFIPRNAPALFNMSALQPLFLDGRVSRDAQGGFHTPAGARLTQEMTRVFEFGALSALPLFPVVNRAEMLAKHGNEFSAVSDEHPEQVWKGMMIRLGRIPEYRKLFEAAYPGRHFDQMNFGYASNAIAGFLIDRLAFNNSPWDRFLGGNNRALTELQLNGAKDFMSAKCSICHNGPDLSDNLFHNVAVVQMGPGEGDGTGHDDFGRMRISGNAAEQYAFRTAPLRNIELSAPYGHDGAYTTLRAFVDHYSESDVKLHNFDPTQLEPLLRSTVLPTADQILATRDPLLAGVFFQPQTIDEVTEFMKALTDPAARNLSALTPARVPSGLSVDGL